MLDPVEDRRRPSSGMIGRMMRVRAPELTGRGWLNTGGRPIHLADLRGKIVLLDFRISRMLLACPITSTFATCT
jgi:hypothetical protein